MSKFRKAWIAFLVALAGGLGSALVAGSLTREAFLAVLGTALVAGAGVYRVPNKG